jgi:hypothetical protein
MTSCIDNDFPCQNPDYSKFDCIASSELKNSVSVDEIVNKSTVCTLLPLDEQFLIDDLTYKNFTKSIGKKMGIYHLWIEHDECVHHETHTMLCVYVGKGIVRDRLNSHVLKKWPGSIHQIVRLYVTFFEVTNRLAKYYEQLFLDLYDTTLNTEENSGADKLYAVWDEERHCLGTQLLEVSSMSKITGFDDE